MNRYLSCRSELTAAQIKEEIFTQSYILLLLATLFWAGNFVWGKYVVTEVTPFQLTYLRWLFALVLLLPLAQWLEKPAWRSFLPQWPQLLILALAGSFGYNFFLYTALEYTTSFHAAVINTLNPLFIFIGSALLLKERLTRRQTAGLIISFIGVLTVVTKGAVWQILSFSYNFGDALMLLSGLLWAFYTIYGKRACAVPPITATALSVFWATAALTPAALLSPWPSSLSRDALIGMTYIIIFPSALAFVFWNRALQTIKAAQVGVFANFVVIFTALISLLLGNALLPSEVFGAVIVLGGVYLTTQTG
ncbi:EamA-like transporter family protein [Megasphaera vaginalis (ex Srinivasan et al. 2021)]|uniref:EamA-like transporter family protein n=1 Tax=Megasphaera vaginalis (ex Srinivasan et al. 2021) TaxID=1111454 RepID=U7UUA2_9FIRM|nr:EamA-like transporter family protein [Megasphaera vaginalis (ex Srinivasan et al. 2021)]